jgi:hypothetical protein
MDHEFFTEQLDATQTGWDWFSLQFDDGTELMLFRLRRKDGAADPYSAGTYIDARGRTTHLARDTFSVTPGKLWNKYPVEWAVRVPSLGIDVQLDYAAAAAGIRKQAEPHTGKAQSRLAGARRGFGYVRDDRLHRSCAILIVQLPDSADAADRFFTGISPENHASGKCSQGRRPSCPRRGETLGPDRDKVRWEDSAMLRTAGSAAGDFTASPARRGRCAKFQWRVR